MDLLLLPKRGRLLPNHTELAYREAVAKLKYLLAESYAPRALATSKRPSARELPAADEYVEEEATSQSCAASPTSGEVTSRNNLLESRSTRGKLSETRKPAPAELRSLIERQEDYIEQLEKESQYCREELRALVDKVREVVAENEALQDQSKTHFFEGTEEEQQQRQQPSIVLESRVSELEAQLTQARLELRQAREGVRPGPSSSSAEEELERTRRQLEARAQERERELARLREREAEAQMRARRAGELAQQADCQRLQAELELARLRGELERRQDELREALQESARRLAEEEQRAERQERRAAELGRELAQTRARGESLTEELRQRTTELQGQLDRATAGREASERQARQEQARLQAELSARAARLERVEAELLQARREQMRLGDEVAALERQMNASRVVEETRVQQAAPQPIAKLAADRSKEERDKDKELAALIYDLESKHGSSGGVTDQQHDNELPHDSAALSSKKRRVKVDLKVKVIPKKKSAQSEPPASKVPIP